MHKLFKVQEALGSLLPKLLSQGFPKAFEVQGLKGRKP